MQYGLPPSSLLPLVHLSLEADGCADLVPDFASISTSVGTLVAHMRVLQIALAINVADINQNLNVPYKFVQFFYQFSWLCFLRQTS